MRDYKDMLKKVSKQWDEMLVDAIQNNQALKKEGIKAQKNTAEGDVQFALREDAKKEVKSALTNKHYNQEIKLTYSSPSILIAQKGVKNLPMMMKASHIRENIFTEEEAKKKGFKVNKNINYHGLGEDLFYKVIDGLDEVKEAYRGTKNAENSDRRENYFLLISQYTDKDGNIINVPVYINEKGLYNRVFIDTNKIATVFGKNEFRKYIREQLNKGNLVRIKNRSIQASESTSPINADYGKNTSKNSIHQNSKKSQYQNADRDNLEQAKGEEHQFADRDYSDYDKPITIEDIRTLRSIGRKSINDFTSEDLEKAQKWAYKFYQQLGEKSPFFRAWFGDWRAYDINKIKYKSNIQLLSLESAEQTKEYFGKGLKDKTLYRGDVRNLDTGYIINVGVQIYNDTITYANRELLRSKNVDNYQARLSILNNIKNIVENSVLLDTEIAFKDNSKNQNMYQSFFHKFYTLVKIQGEYYLVKLTVDELNSESPIRRAYNVNDIKISPVAVSQVYEPADTTDDNGDSLSTISISNLHEIVKQYDKSFTPKPVDKHLVNEDGTPKKFYHGTNESFTEFNPDEFAPREGSFFFAENREDAEAYGNNVFEVYLTGDKFADYDNQPSEFYQLRDKRKQVEYLKERGYDGWYADMDSGGWGEVSVFSNTQIKSATSNIGTFDKTKGDIRYSDRDEVNVYDLMGENERLVKEKRSFVYHHCERKYSLRLMICTFHVMIYA